MYIIIIWGGKLPIYHNKYHNHVEYGYKENGFNFEKLINLDEVNKVNNILKQK